MRVSLVAQEPAPNVGRLGDQAAAEIQRWLEALGVRLILGSEVEAIKRSEDRLTVIAGDESPAGELVVMAVGVKPRAELAALAGLDLENGSDPGRCPDAHSGPWPAGGRRRVSGPERRRRAPRAHRALG